MFHLMPYRDLPADFDRRYQSAYLDPVWFDVADADKVGQYYNARSTRWCMPPTPACMACAPTSITRTSMASWPIRASWARCWQSSPTARTSPSSSLARRCPRPRRRRGSPRNTRCSTASAAAGWWRAFRRDCRPMPPSPTASSRSSSASAFARRSRWWSRRGRPRRSSPGTASIISSPWSICGRGRSSSPIRRSGFRAPASPPPPNTSSIATIASAT